MIISFLPLVLAYLFVKISYLKEKVEDTAYEKFGEFFEEIKEYKFSNFLFIFFFLVRRILFVSIAMFMPEYP